ncbi:MAG: hypothetical protein ACJ764_01925 [Solirubrobacteraceae bacterium]
MPLFNREERKAKQAALQAEVDRLQALSPDELAMEVLPALGSEELKRRLTGVRVQDVVKATLAGESSWTINTGVLLLPVREALQRLEHANLVLQMASGSDEGTRWRITTEGEQRLANGDVAQALGVKPA